MECRNVRDLAEAFVSEQLLVETTQVITRHLDRCPACRAEVEGLRRLRLAARSAFDRSAELRVRPGFAAEVSARLAAQARRDAGGRAPRRAWMTIAASLLAIAAVGSGLRGWSAASLSAARHAAVGDHRFCALAFALQERPIDLENAAQRYGGIYHALASVEPSTTMLSGGPIRIVERHSCVFDGRRFAHLVLRYKNETVSLVIVDDPRSAPARWAGRLAAGRTPGDVGNADGFRVTSFGTPPHLAFMVSSLSEADMREVTAAMLGPVTRAMTGA